MRLHIHWMKGVDATLIPKFDSEGTCNVDIEDGVLKVDDGHIVLFVPLGKIDYCFVDKR